jgi:anthranilate phosphoribosyltransferase
MKTDMLQYHLMKRPEREHFIKQKLDKIFPPPPKALNEELASYASMLRDGGEMRPDEAKRAMEIMISGESGEHETALFLACLSIENISPENLAGMASIMSEKAIKITPLLHGEILADSCGTGGDNLHTFNISTTIMFILAAAGIKIAKHGNRASTSKCGSADVLEELGIKIDLGPSDVARCIERAGAGFMFAPRYHPAMKNVAAVRKKLPFRTVFNILGPLCNPAPVTYQLLGVYSPEILELMAGTLANLRIKRALVVCGSAGEGVSMDEVSTIGITKGILIAEGGLKRIEISPGDLNLPKADLRALKGGGCIENAGFLKAILQGIDRGPRRDICLANAAAGIYGAGLVGSIADGVAMAREIIDEGSALRKLERLIEESNLT